MNRKNLCKISEPILPCYYTLIYSTIFLAIMVFMTFQPLYLSIFINRLWYSQIINECRMNTFIRFIFISLLYLSRPVFICRDFQNSQPSFYLIIFFPKLWYTYLSSNTSTKLLILIETDIFWIVTSPKCFSFPYIALFILLKLRNGYNLS